MCIRDSSDDWVKQDAYFKILDTLRELAGGGQALDMLISNYAVSYTHLDVYKRQTSRSCRSLPISLCGSH